ncbi:MAG: Adenine phosphoribosyltransferase [Ignavibacteriae bacterium]|nr:MAG: Adenine phosphoribosyltransferase [Ignavibacteriota bacterium]
MEDLKKYIRNILDFPRKGILFRDITPLLNNPDAFDKVINYITDYYKGMNVDKIVGIESRGFILGSVLAYKLKAGFVPARKPGKLPYQTIKEEYKLEYGIDAIEIHRDAIREGDNVVLHDDLLATGGTASAACKLIEKLGGKIIGVSFLIELKFLNGREKLKKYDVHSLISYDSEQ